MALESLMMVSGQRSPLQSRVCWIFSVSAMATSVKRSSGRRNASRAKARGSHEPPHQELGLPTGLVQVLGQDAPHGRAETLDLGIRQTVVDVDPLPAHREDAPCSQDGRVLGEFGLGDAEPGQERSVPPLSGPDLVEDPEADGVHVHYRLTYPEIKH